MDKKGLSCVLRCWMGIIFFYLCQDAYGVKVLDVSILSSSNHTYVIQEESAVIMCNYKLNDDSEQLKSVHWSLERGGKHDEIYVWKQTDRSKAKGIFKGRTETRERDPRKLVIVTADIEMHGTLKCNVKTSENADSKEKPLVIIVDACSESDWKFIFDKEKCTETVQFKCTGFFPKPTSNCGLYDRITQSYITSFGLDSITTKRDNTFDLSVTRQFHVSAAKKHDDVILLCEIIVYNSDYKFKIQREEMFGERGCPANYPSGGDAEANATGIVETCWEQPVNGSVVTYQCENGETMKTITCVDGKWMDESDVTVSDQFCNGSPGLGEMMQFAFSILLYGAISFFIW